jgi:hypothetical protein
MVRIPVRRHSHDQLLRPRIDTRRIRPRDTPQQPKKKNHNPSGHSRKMHLQPRCGKQPLVGL